MLKFSRLVGLLLFLAAPAAYADVQIETLVKSGGFQGMGAYEGLIKRQIRSNRSREDADIKYTGRMMKLMAGGLRSKSEIVRVDLDKIWTINPTKKTYTERPITLPVDEKPASDKSREPSSDGPDTPVEKPTHRLKKTDVSVGKTGEKKTVNGFPTEEIKAAVSVEVEEIATKEVTIFHSDTRVWQTPMTKDLKKALDEEKKFMQAYVAKIRGGIAPQDQGPLGGGQLALVLGLGPEKSAVVIKSLQTKLAQFDGYPIVTDSKWFVQEDPKTSARRDAARAEDQDDSPEFTTDPKDIAGGLIGGFAKKKMKERQQKADKAKEGAPVFATYVEVKSLATGPRPDASFEIPAGFKKVK